MSKCILGTFYHRNAVDLSSCVQTKWIIRTQEYYSWWFLNIENFEIFIGQLALKQVTDLYSASHNI